MNEVVDIINYYGLSMPKEYVEEYRNVYQYEHEIKKLFFETKTTQKKYLELMKDLLKKDSALGMELFNEELNELGFTTENDIKKLIIKK